MGKIIFHVDMNSFFVSCEAAENPSLYHKEVAVAPNASRRKSMILAASYEAKAKGVKTTMLVGDALRLCPNLIVVPSRHELYQEYSNRFFAYFYSLTKLVEPASIDEGFLDVTDLCQNEDPIALAQRIQRTLWEEYHLPSSIGIGPNKLLAKMASDMKKPMGITVLRKREIDKLMWPLKVGDLLGVGKKTVPILNSLGIYTIGDLANYKDLAMLERFVGKKAVDYYIQAANGIGSNVVDPNRYAESQSIGHSTTFDVNEHDNTKVLYTFKVLTNAVCERLRKEEVKAHTITIQVKFRYEESFTKSKSIVNATNDEDEIFKIVEDLYDNFRDNEQGIRLIGVSCSKLVKYQEEVKQMSIFDHFDKEEKDRQIKNLIDNVNKQVGKDALTKGLKKKEE